MAAANGTEKATTDGIGQLAQSIFTQQSVAAVSKVVGEKAAELKRQAEDGDHSLRFLALLGGIVLMVVALLQFGAKIMSFQFVGALIQFYSFCVAIIIIVLESKNMMLSSGFRSRIFKYAPFLKFLWGRGVLNFIVGTLQLSHLDLWSFVVGVYMCAIGALMVFVGQRTAFKLKKIRKSLFSKEELFEKFGQSDLDGDGSLDLQQFRNLTLSLGLDMTRRETEAAFNHIKLTESEKLTYEEFYSWWDTTDMEDDIHENAFSCV